MVVRGAAADGGTIRAVRVNGQPAAIAGPNYSQWEVVLERVVAGGARACLPLAEDEAGNIEQTPHRVAIMVR